MAKTQSETQVLLAKELKKLIPKLDEEGLTFLIEQARVHIYNLGIEKLEAEISQPLTLQKSNADFRIERSPSGASYHIITGGKWKMFTDEEMLSLVKIAQSEDPLPDVVKRVWNWLNTERPDSFVELDIENAHDPRMEAVVALLQKKFAVRQ